LQTSASIRQDEYPGMVVEWCQLM